MSLQRITTLPGLFITATDTEVGKTIIAGAIADWFRRRARRVGVLKPVASGCVKRREGLVSEDAEFLAHCADARFPLDLICPNRYFEPLAPSVAADRAGVAVDFGAVQRSIDLMSASSDVMIVEGAGGVMTPLSATVSVLDVMEQLKLPVVIVARPGLGTVNHTVLTVDAVRARGLKVVGVVINRYPPDRAGVVEETNPALVEKWAKVPVLTLVPDVDAGITDRLPADVVAAIDRVDWDFLSR